MTTCPFCGSDETDVRPNPTHDAFQVACLACRGRGPEAIAKANARLLWEQRASEEEA